MQTTSEPIDHGAAVRMPVVHCFEFEGAKFGFFVRTADLMRLNDDAYLALQQVERGQAPGAAVESLRGLVEPGRFEALAGDFAALDAAGMFTPELDITSGDIERACSSLLAHKPRNLMFFVTEACNLACAYCYEKNQGVHDRPATLTQVDARKTLERYFEESAGRDVTITFFGGEPLLNFPVVRDATRYAEELATKRKVKVDFTMTTNLTLLTEEIADFLAAHKFHVMVSLDGAKDGNDRYRKFKNGGGTYDVATQNLKLLIEKLRGAGVRLPKLRATLAVGNSDADAVEEHLRSLGTNFVEVGETHGTVEGGLGPYDVSASSAEGRAARARFRARVTAVAAALDAGAPLPTDLPASLFKSLRRIHEDISREQVASTPAPKLCGVCRNMKAVTPGGDLYPCHRYVGMPAFKMGNMHAGGLDRERVREYYADLYENYSSHCTKCWARYLCGGQCPWYLSTEDGRVVPPDEASCDGIRSGFEANLALYATLLDRHPDAFRRLLNAEPETIKGVDLINAPDDSCQR